MIAPHLDVFRNEPTLWWDMVDDLRIRYRRSPKPKNQRKVRKAIRNNPKLAKRK